ncbi:zinc finger protein [Stylonychia lemnae]|uniref:Zinc finger protein n=1 Tax=Stylonychia lemnae TaxID=5949 RepID=A0A078A8S2_STYLE|nr:zinc finger protein [Stylonychia lemnae]|eukprot:CDW78670.1 zinc finger protein [Stylonychia lemnae]
MQHNLQDFLRLSTHWIHSSQSLIKNISKREIITQNFNELYSQENFEQFYCHTQRDRKISKNRILSVQDTSGKVAESQYDIESSLDQLELQSIKEINQEVEKMLDSDYFENQHDQISDKDQHLNPKQKSEMDEYQKVVIVNQNKKLNLVISTGLSGETESHPNQSHSLSYSSNLFDFKPSKGVIQQNAYAPRFSFDAQDYYKKQEENLGDQSQTQKSSLSVHNFQPNSQADDVSNYQWGFKTKYKTEICRNWELYGYCEFSQSCSFAHGEHELQRKQHVPQNYKTKLCKQYHEHLYCPYGMRCQFLHSEAKSEQKIDIAYTQKLVENAQLINQIIQQQSQSLIANSNKKNEPNIGTISNKSSSKKTKDPLEGVFGKGKRLPVFTVITFNNKDQAKKSKGKKQNAGSSTSNGKKVHKFGKQHSEKITNAKNLEPILFPSTPSTQISLKRSNKKKMILNKEELQNAL